MGLPWVRLESNIASHDKILTLVAHRGGKSAAAVYMFSLAWSGAHATDGHIPRAALPLIHGAPADAQRIQAAGLWEPNGDGWNIHNWNQRQELAVVTEVKRQAQRRGALRANCIRWHGPDCGCWQETP